MHARLRPTLRLLHERSVVPEAAVPLLEARGTAALKLRNSALMAGALIATVYLVGIQVI